MDKAQRWDGIYCLAWTLLLAAGYFGGQFNALFSKNPAAWSDDALPALTLFYWVLLAFSAAYWWFGRKR